MSGLEASLPESLPLLAAQAMLLFCRIGACCMLLPGIGEAEVPAPLRLALPLALVALLLPGLAPAMPVPDSVPGLLRLIAFEVAIGLFLGWLARLAALAFAMAGQIIGFMIGLSNVLTQDVAMAGAGSSLSRFLGLAAAVVVLSTGLYALPVRALADSYAALPPGAPLAVEALTREFGDTVAWSLGLALRLAAPFVLLSLLVQLLFGLVGRVAPQTQAFILAAPAQAIFGLLLLGLMLPLLMTHWADAVDAAWQLLPGLA